ncbi:MAG TPA: hypothetical protein EYP69_00450 [Bacteroidales bacterium]|nr:hypothetical protein [Bacteroidales bacterium]
MKINKSMKMADVIHLNYHLISVLYRFNINLGFGEKSVEQTCIQNNVNPDFFLEIANAFIDKNYFPDDKLQNFSLSIIINYLQATHRYYTDEKIPELKILFKKLINTANSSELMMIQQFFEGYLTEFYKHINKEEKKVYPYILQLEKYFLNKKVTKSFYNQFNQYRITDYEQEHNNIEEKLFDLKNILIKYIPPINDYHLVHQILSKLFRLEKDINDHSHIEDKVLIPKVKKMERLFAEALKTKQIIIEG